MQHCAKHRTSTSLKSLALSTYFGDKPNRLRHSKACNFFTSIVIEMLCFVALFYYVSGITHVDTEFELICRHGKQIINVNSPLDFATDF